MPQTSPEAGAVLGACDASEQKEAMSRVRRRRVRGAGKLGLREEARWAFVGAGAGLLGCCPVQLGLPHRAFRHLSGWVVPPGAPGKRPRHGLLPRAVPAWARWPSGQAVLGPGKKTGLVLG